jgi:predicted P-loop ATPase
MDGTFPNMDEAKEAAAEPDEWSQYLQRDDHGNAIPNLANAAHILRRAPMMVGLFAYDEMLRHPLLQKAIPGGRSEPLSEPRPMHDADIGVVQEWLQRHELRRLGKDVAAQAIDLVARENDFHPVRDYLTGLIWDGTPRLLTWLNVYLGADDTPYHAGIGKMFLVAMVARIMRPGCKADYMPVFEGPQGARKSTACAILGGKWFSDSLPDLHHVDAVRLSMHLRGKWVIEIAEMSSISKAEAGALKAFLTQTEERYLPKYARTEVIEPRQCIFVGTTNKAAYLRDETGGRRFWPVKVGTIDTDALVRDRDQLFAEAMRAYTTGVRWWPTQAFEAEHIAPEQEARFEADAWEEEIRAFVAGKSKVTVLQVAREGLFIDLPKVGTADQRRIAAAMERMGWERGARAHGGVRVWEKTL